MSITEPVHVYFDEAYARQQHAWFWRVEDHDNESVGPFPTKQAAIDHARENGFRVMET